MLTSMKFCLVTLLVVVSAIQSPFDQTQGYQPSPQQIVQQAPLLNLGQQDVSAVSSLNLVQQFPQQLPQRFMQGPQVADPGMGGFTTKGQAAQDVNVQDVLGLVDSMGEQQRKAKTLQAQLLQAQTREEQLNGMVLAETYRSNTIDQNARRLAQQSQESISSKKHQVDDLRKQLAKFKAQAEETSVRLADEENSNQRLNSELSQARRMLQDWQLKVAAANHRAHEAELREMNALKAGELEDVALTQQEELLNKMKRGHAGETMFDDHQVSPLALGAPLTSVDDSPMGFHSAPSSGGATDNFGALLQPPIVGFPDEAGKADRFLG